MPLAVQTDIGQVLLTPTLFSAAIKDKRLPFKTLLFHVPLVPLKTFLRLTSTHRRSQSAEMNTSTPLDLMEAEHHHLMGLRWRSSAGD